MRWIKSRYSKQLLIVVMAVLLITLISSLAVYAQSPSPVPSSSPGTAVTPSPSPLSNEFIQNMTQLAQEGRQIFRYDTFGDEAFWGDTLNLHQAIQGSKFGGTGDGVSPKTALSVGLKVDMDALPASLVTDLKAGKVDLTAPATTLALLKLNAVVGVTGIFDQGGTKLTSMGIQCAFCHSTVDNAFAYGIGHRLDGLANHDLNVGAIISLAPNLQPVADVLGVDVATVKTVLAAWGPGKFDAELFLDGKGFNPQQMTDGKVTGTNVSGATLIPNALGLGGHSQHTWTGAWGGIPYWNAFVAVLEMHGIGNFFDPRLDDATKFPIAAKNKLGHIQVDPDSDQVTSKLPALQYYQLSLSAPAPVAGKDFDAAAAMRGDELFSGKAKCQSCHNENIWTEAGWDLHKASEVGIDDFQANRGPDGVLKTANLNALYIRENALYMDPANQGRYYHDGRFKTLKDVVAHYNTFLNLGLTDAEMSDLVEYLKSFPTTTPTVTPAASTSPTASASPSASPRVTTSPSVVVSPTVTTSPARTTTVPATTTPARTTTASPTTAKAVTIDLVAQNIAFNMSSITVPAGAQVTVNFNNKDSVAHTFSVYTNSSASTVIFKGNAITGPATTTYKFTAPTTPGTYFFRCDIHPAIMTGQFIVQ